MQKVLLFFAFLAGCFISYAQNNSTNITENNLTLIEIENIIRDVKFEDEVNNGESYVSLNLGEQYMFSSEVGAPRFPLIIKLIEVPEDAAISIDILAETNITYDLRTLGARSPLFPVQPGVPKQSESITFVKNEKIYGQDAFWGFDVVSVEEIGSLSGMRMAKVIISPIKYNPVKQQIEVIDYLRVQISFTGADIEKTVRRKNITNQTYNYLYDQKISNYKNFNPKHNELPTHPYKYIIVSPEEFKETLKPFIRWKEEKGFNVQSIYTEDPQVGRTPDSIRNYLKALYESATEDDPAATFLLIAGSNNIIPAFQKPVSSSALLDRVGNDYSPSDLYFAEYTDDFFPEVFYGRFPANNTAELRNMIEKTIEYEKYQLDDFSYLNNVLLFAGKEYNPVALTATNGVLNYLKTTYLSGGQYGMQVDTLVFYNPNTSKQKSSILSRIKEGNSMIYYSGHCAANALSWSLGDGKSITSKEITASSSDNYKKYFFSVNNCCLSNKYDLKGNTCFGEGLIKAENCGAIGVIGASNETLWYEDFYWAVGAKGLSRTPAYDANAFGAFDMFFHTHDEKLSQHHITQGQMLSAGNLAVTQSGSAYEQYYWEIYCLFGDPSLMPYVGMPQQMSFQIPASIDKGVDSISITGTPLAYVSILDDTVSLAAGLLDETGKRTFYLKYPVINDNDLNIIATKQFFQPYFDSITVNTPAESKIVFSKYAIFGKNGILLNKLKAEEDLELKIALKNVGGELSSGKMTIESADTNVIFENNTFMWQNVPAGETVETTPFLFNTKTLNSKWVEFKVIMEENGIETNNRFSIEVETLFLEYYSVEVQQNENHGNGFNIKVVVRNIGQDRAKDVTIYTTSLMPEEAGINFDKAEYIIGDLSFLETGEKTIKVEHSANRLKDKYVDIILNIVCKGGYSFEKQLRVPLSKATEDFETNSFSLFEWENNSSSPWKIENSKEYVFNGKFSARSGKIGDSEKSTLSITADVLENDSIHFMYTVSSDNKRDYLSFFIDAELKGQWSGITNKWKEASFPVTSGRHKFTWEYIKDFDGYRGLDCAWIDNIRFPLSMNILSIRDLLPEEGKVNVVPNPSNGIVSVFFNQDSSVYTAYIYDSYGKLLMEKKPFNNEDQLDLQHLSSGVYLLILKTDKKHIGKKIVVTK